MAQIQTSNPDILPRSFVTAMRTLFRIMDDQNTGFVKYSDIEERWQDDGTQGLPKGVLESLKKVTPPNGLLTFEGFCAGLKICLLQIQNGAESKQREGQPNRPPSAPILADSQNKPAWTSPNTAAIRPNNAISQQRTLSMPQLLGVRKDIPNVPMEVTETRNAPDSKAIKSFGPPKPPRTGAATESRALSTDRNFDKSEIRTVLQNWQMGLMMSKDKCQAANTNYQADSRTLLRPARALGDGKSVDLQSNQNGLPPKKNMGRRREPRRHTLQNGIDYNMMKRMHQIEQEKDLLLQGLAAVDKAREWYLKQISSTQEKIKHLGRMGSHVEQWTEAQQERLELQRARVFEVNSHLAALITSWERGGLPLHMNLAFLSTPSSAQLHQDMLSRLKHQNHRLTEEVSKKSHKIALLEQEKDNLMRELYSRQAGMVQSRRSTMIHEQHDQTFISTPISSSFPSAAATTVYGRVQSITMFDLRSRAIRFHASSLIGTCTYPIRNNACDSLGQWLCGMSSVIATRNVRSYRVSQWPDSGIEFRHSERGKERDRHVAKIANGSPLIISVQRDYSSPFSIDAAVIVQSKPSELHPGSKSQYFFQGKWKIPLATFLEEKLLS